MAGIRRRRQIVKEGEMDIRFYIIVAGNCAMARHGERIGRLSSGGVFRRDQLRAGAKAHRDHSGGR